MSNRISHIGVLVNNLEEATKFWSETYGLKQYSQYVAEVEGLKAVLLSASGQGGEMSIELIEPLDKEDLSNPVARRLANNGEGFYHLAVEVGDIAETGRQLQEKGLEVMQRLPISEQARGRWLVHPKSSNGVMVEGI